MIISQKYTNKKRIVTIFAVFVLLMAYVSSLAVKAAGTAAHTAQLSSMEASAYAGTGSSSDPYRIAVAGSESGSNTAFTAPNSFWGDTSADTGVSNAALVFERFEGDTTDGKLISSMAFNLGKNGTDVWDGTWTYALRLAPWTGFDTTTGDLRLGFSYKGNFAAYFNDWTFKFDAQRMTADLEEDKQAKPGDTISLTYIGAYDDGQTSKGTNYVINYADVDSNVESVVSAVVDDNGYAAFSGANMIIYGGNYQAAITNRSDDSEGIPDDSTQIPDDTVNTPDPSDKEDDMVVEEDETLQPDNEDTDHVQNEVVGEVQDTDSNAAQNMVTVSPKTGDASNTQIYVVICSAAGAGILIALRKIRRA